MSSGMLAELFSVTGAVVLLPVLAAAVLAMLENRAVAGWLNIAAATGTFALACLLPWQMAAGTLLLVDPLAAHMAILTSFVAMTTAWFSLPYIATEAASGRLEPRRVRHYHALFQAFLAAMLMALLSNNFGVTWVSIEAATIAAVLVVGLPRTAEAVEASWKYFMLCGVGISLAFFGTIVLTLAVLPAVGAGPEGALAAMRWSALPGAASHAAAPLLNLAFVFLLVGYGTKAGLAPLHAWLPDAHAEGPTPVSAVLSGSILNVALVVILRLRGVMDANPAAMAPGPPIIVLGLLSVLLAAFSLWRRRDVKRFFAFSTIEQSGVAAFAFGLGGPLASFAGLLHLTLHTLAKAAVFQCVGHACQAKGSQLFSEIGGLLAGHRALALTLAAGIIAVAALPPFGLFTSEFLIITATMRQAPWLAVPLAIGLVVGGWALGWRLITLCTGPATPDKGPARGPLVLLPVWLHLALVAVLGFAMPATLVAWFTTVAGSLR
jgi:hydrogenase-4 component F